MSMVGYVLGLGDRHPSNLLIDRISGSVVHVVGPFSQPSHYLDRHRITPILLKSLENGTAIRKRSPSG
jgi:hypothetical protein